MPATPARMRSAPERGQVLFGDYLAGWLRHRDQRLAAALNTIAMQTTAPRVRRCTALPLGRRVPLCATSLRDVTGPERPSERLVEQRLRNRAMDSLAALSEGDSGVRRAGVNEYVNQFFDIIDDDSPWQWRDWSCFTPEEVKSLGEVNGLLSAACAATPKIVTADGFINSGWPAKIQPAARLALSVMNARGRFREDVEESTPSQ